MSQYRTKQVLFDAIRIPASGADFDPANVSDLEWVLDAALAGKLRRTETGVSLSLGDQGVQNGAPGDWLMRGSDGSIMICDDAHFTEFYEPMPDSGAPQPQKTTPTT